MWSDYTFLKPGLCEIDQSRKPFSNFLEVRANPFEYTRFYPDQTAFSAFQLVCALSVMAGLDYTLRRSRTTSGGRPAKNGPAFGPLLFPSRTVYNAPNALFGLTPRPTAVE